MGRCKSFDASADGYGRGEGFSIMVLRSKMGPDLASPGAAGSGSVLAVVHGSAVNQDGRSSSLIAPNGPSQQVSQIHKQNANALKRKWSV